MFHTTIRSENNLTLFPSEEQLLRAVHAVGRVSRGMLLAFNLVDNHLHLLSSGDRAMTGRLAGRIGRSLGAIASTPMAPGRPTPIRDRSHLRNTMRYLVQQPLNHEIGTHPALWAGSSFADLVGARYVPDLRLRAREELPRMTTTDLLAWAGLPEERLSAATDEELANWAPAQLVRAAARAGALDKGLVGRRSGTVVWRRAVAQLACEVGHAPGAVAAALRVTRQGLLHCRRAVRPVRHIETLRKRVALERLAAAPPCDEVEE